MKNLVPAVLPRLESFRIAGLDAGSQVFYPYYDGHSLANLPASVCHWLDVPTFGSTPLEVDLLNQWQKPFRQVITLVVDGLGLNMVQDALAGQDETAVLWNEISREAVLAPMTSIVPSTTAAALTTLWTGVPPSEHGVFAYEVWLKEFGMITNMISHAPASYAGDSGSLEKAGFDPLAFLPVPTLGPHLLKHGVRTVAFQHQSIAFSGLSRMLFPAVQVQAFHTQSDLWVSLGQVMDSPVKERRYLYVYWGDLDEIMHRFGPDDDRTRLELLAFSRQLAGFLHRCKGRGDTLFILTADHGHVSTPRQSQLELRSHPELLNCLVMMPSGEARLPVAYLRPGKEADFRQYVENTWPGLFKIVPSEQAVRAGLFGKRVYPRFYERVGDLMLVPQDDASYWYFGLTRENRLLGRHGGLSRTEMLIPFWATVI